VADQGVPTVEHSWFDGYAWQLSYCEQCANYLHAVAPPMIVLYMPT
jgi:hypothetical protein